MTIAGEVITLLGVLGLRQGDDRILKAVILVGPGMEIEEFPFDGQTQDTYFTFRQAGTDLLFEDEVLVAAIVMTRPSEKKPGYGRYPRPEALIKGLSPTATRTKVANFFEIEPERTGPTFIRYDIDGRYLHLEFDSDNRIEKITTMLEPV